jgi:hypothetical protein
MTAAHDRVTTSFVMNKRVVLLCVAAVAVGIGLARYRDPDVDAPLGVRIQALRSESITAAPTLHRTSLAEGLAPHARSRVEPYNPIQLSRDEDLPMDKVFEREERDPEYAPIFETRIRNLYGTLLVRLGARDRVREIVVECKTLTCRTYFQVAKHEQEEMYDLLTVIPVAPLHSPSILDDEDPALANVTIYSSYDPAMRDAKQFDHYVGGLIEHRMAMLPELLEFAARH